MPDFFDIVIRGVRVGAPVDNRREFFSEDVGALDAPAHIPGGSTILIEPISSPDPFMTTRFVNREN